MKGKTLLCLVLVTSMLLGVFMIGPVGAQSTTIGVEPDSIVDPGLGPGSWFTVEVWIRGVADLAGVEFYLGYDTTVLTATLITYGDIFGIDYFPLASEIHDDEGYLWYSIMEGFGEPGFYGDGRVAIITFSVDSLGESTLDLNDTKLGDDAMPPNPIPHDALDGYFSNVEAHDIAVTSVTATPTHVTVGELVVITVTVVNQGTFVETFDVSVYYDMVLIETITGVTLTVGGTTTLDFTWETTGVAEGIYTIRAEASILAGEDDTADNTFIDGQVTVSAAPVLPDIIIVNDNDGSYWISGTSLPEFESALTVAGYDYYLWNEYSMGNPPLDFLTKFQLVIWTCGDCWGWAVDPTDAVTLESYLAQGGNILLEGEDLGYDHDADSFMVNVAHAVYQVDDTGAPGLTVTDPTHPLTFDLPTSFTWLTDPPYDDGVSPTNGGAEVIQYTGTAWTAVTVFEGASYGSVVYYAFPLYCLAQSEGQTLVLNSINWLLGVKFEHELAVSLEAPEFLKPGDSSLLNATVHNFGLSNETDVELQLLINGSLINSMVIPELASNSSYTLSCLWTPILEGSYNITGYAPPVPEEEFTANNRVTKFVTVAEPLIQPVEGQWANYTITLTEKATNTSQVTLLNSTYSRYISPHQMNVTLWMTDPWGGTMTTWLILNVMTRQVESGMWAGMWYPLWIETNFTIGSFVRIFETTGTVIGSRFVEVGELLIDSWELQVLYGRSYIFLFDKVTGVVTGVEGDDHYYHEHWELTATNILRLLPPEALEELIETIETWNLLKGTENGLTSKLDGAIHLLNKGNENGAIHKLMDFINQVEALRGKKLTNEQADYLTAEAQRIIDLIEEQTP